MHREIEDPDQFPRLVKVHATEAPRHREEEKYLSLSSLCLGASVACYLQTLPSGEASIEIVPPFDALLATLPAEVNCFAVALVGKIDEAALEILDLDAMAEYLLDAGQEIGERIRVLHAIDGSATAFRSALAGALHLRRQPLEDHSRFIYLLEESSHLR